ncbi:MAG: sulfatase, partial [Myxococcota bacterium]
MNAPSKARDSAAPSGPQWGLRWRRTEPFRRRVALGAMVGSLGGVALAALDAQWLRGSGSETLPSPTEIFLADAGAVVPLTLALGLMVGVVSWVLHQRIDPSPNEFVRQLRAHATGRPADIAAFAPLACLGLFLWMTGVAQLARLLLVTDTTAANVGALIATVSSVLGLVTALTVLALTPWLRQKLAALSSATKAAVDPAVTLGVAALLCGSLFAFGVNQGDQSGHGGFFAIYGVLKRQALDLRMPTMLI